MRNTPGDRYSGTREKRSPGNHGRTDLPVSDRHKKTARIIQGGRCIKKERAGYSFMNLFIIVARGEMNLMK